MGRSRVLAGSTVGLMLAGGLVAATPVTTADAAPRYHKWGFVKSRNHVLRPGCHRYTYRYKIDPPKPRDSYAGEIFLIGPGGVNLASAAKISPYSPPRAKAKFKLCAPSVRYGRHRLRMKVTYKVGYNKFESWVRPTTFRFVRPRRR